MRCQCGAAASYTEVCLFHDSMQIIGIGYVCVDCLREGQSTNGRDIINLLGILTRAEAQDKVYLHWSPAPVQYDTRDDDCPF